MFVLVMLFLLAAACIRRSAACCSAIKQNETRAAFLGYNVWLYKWLAFVLSAAHRRARRRAVRDGAAVGLSERDEPAQVGLRRDDGADRRRPRELLGPGDRRGLLHPRARPARRLHRDVAALVRARSSWRWCCGSPKASPASGRRLRAAARARGWQATDMALFEAQAPAQALRRPRRAARTSTSRSRRARLHRHHGSQRRRQDDLLQRADRHATRRTAGASRSPARTSPGCAPRAIARRGVARSFQVMNLFDDYTALDNVTGRDCPSCARAASTPGATAARDAARRTRRRRCSRGSGLRGHGGVRRRRASPTASGARSRSAWRSPREPRLLFLDEPTAGLGADGTARLADLVARAASGKVTMVIIEHDMRFLFGLADRISVIHWGQVIARGTPAELRANPWVQRSEPRCAGGVMLERRRHRHVSTARRRRCSASRSTWPPARSSRCSAPNGAGKTTTLRSILGLTRRAPRQRRVRRARHHARADARDRARAASAGCRTTAASSRRSPWRATSRSRARSTRFRAWTLERVLRDLLGARVPAAARVREPVGRRDADGGDLARAARRARASCCSTSRARASRRRSCRT